MATFYGGNYDTETATATTTALSFGDDGLLWVQNTDNIRLSVGSAPSPKPKRFIENLRDEIGNWHGDILKAA